MSIIKDFDQFNESLINEMESNEPKMITPKNGEIARWRIVLRSGSPGTINTSKPEETLIRELSENGAFKAWWNKPPAPNKEGQKNVAQDYRPNTQYLPILYMDKYKQSNWLGKEVAKAEIAFVRFVKTKLGKSQDGHNTGEVCYDVTRRAPISIVPVEGGTEFGVWDEQSLTDCSIKNATGWLDAIDKKRKYIYYELITPPYMYRNSKLIDNSTDNNLGANTSSTNTNTNTNTNGQGTGANTNGQGTGNNGQETGNNGQGTGNNGQGTGANTNGTGTGDNNTKQYIGLQLDNSDKKYNALVKDLQSRILQSTNKEAAEYLNRFGGADGHYGHYTAHAIYNILNPGVVNNGQEGINVINQDVADKLAKVLPQSKPVAPVADKPKPVQGNPSKPALPSDLMPGKPINPGQPVEVVTPGKRKLIL